MAYHGIRVIGKQRQKDNIQYRVIKTKKGYYPEAKGERYHKVGDRQSKQKYARNILRSWMK